MLDMGHRLWDRLCQTYSNLRLYKVVLLLRQDALYPFTILVSPSTRFEMAHPHGALQLSPPAG